MTPLLSKSLVAQLNNSKDNGSFVIESRHRGVCLLKLMFYLWLFKVVEPIQVVTISSSGGVCDSLETVTGVIPFLLFSEDVSSDNIGNKEFSMGTFFI